MIKTNIFAAVILVSFGIGVSPAFALIPNGDFETGDLSGYSVEKMSVPVDSYPTVKNVDDGTGNRVGEVSTGPYVSTERRITLGKDLGPLPADVEALFFDVKFFDLGPETPPGTPGASTNDSLFAVLNVDGFNENLFIMTDEIFLPRPIISSETLDNGFYRIRADLSSYAGSSNAKLQLNMNNNDDQYNARFWVDNIDVTTANQTVAPEPSTMLLLGGGLAGMFLRARKRKQA